MQHIHQVQRVAYPIGIPHPPGVQLRTAEADQAITFVHGQPGLTDVAIDFTHRILEMYRSRNGLLFNDIEHIDQQTQLGYQTWRKPLKAQLLVYLERRKELLTDQKLLQEAQEAGALIVNIPPDEQNVHFNLDFEAGVYAAYGSKKEASEAYTTVIRGPEGVKLSAHSLRKSDIAKYYSAADRVEERLSDKRDALIKLFRLLLSSQRRK